METIEQMDDNFNVKKPKKKGLIIAGIIVAVIIIALLFVYFLVFAKPQYVFNSAIDKMFNIESQDYDSIKAETTVKASAELEDTSIQQQIGELEKYSLNFGTQMDLEEQQEIVDLGLQYDNQSVIDARVYYDNGDLYAYFDEIFDKYIKIDMTEEQKNEINEMFEYINSKGKKKNSEKAMEIIGDELKTQINEKGNFEKSKETIDIEGKDKRVTKSTLELNQKELVNLLEDMCSNLADNEEFIECFEDSSATKDTLEQFTNTLKDVETNTDKTIEFSIYTKRNFQNLCWF